MFTFSELRRLRDLILNDLIAEFDLAATQLSKKAVVNTEAPTQTSMPINQQTPSSYEQDRVGIMKCFDVVAA